METLQMEQKGSNSCSDKEKWIKIDDATIENLKDIIEGKDVIDGDELEILKQKRIQVGTDEVLLSRLFLRNYDHLKGNLFQFEAEEFDSLDGDGCPSEKLRTYLEQFDIAKLRELVSNYGDGTYIGDFYTKYHICEDLKCNRKRYEELINVFFKIFTEKI